MKLNKTIEQFAKYLMVGIIATLVEWVFFYYLHEKWFIHYLFATALAFIVSTFANWLAGRLILFKKKQGILLELGKVYMTSIIGLFFNFIIMWITIEQLGVPAMGGKMIATGLVFFWNFLVRKYLIYNI